MAPSPQDTPQPDPSSTPKPDPDDAHHSLGAGYIVLIVLILLLVLVGGYLIYINYRARKLGLPTPGINIFASVRGDRIPTRNYPARGGVLGWAESKVRNFRNRRTAAGAYEGTALADNASAPGRRRGFGRLDPDEAWDARVGNEADAYDSGPYYGEETELHDQDPMYGHTPSYAADARGRSRDRDELDRRYEEETGMVPPSRHDPFTDRAEPSGLRGVSPRPHDDGRARYNKSPSPDSPTERKSVFREADM